MKWTVLVAKPARKQHARFPAKDQTRISAAVAQLANDPFSGHVQKLEGEGSRSGVGVWAATASSFRGTVLQEPCRSAPFCAGPLVPTDPGACELRCQACRRGSRAKLPGTIKSSTIRLPCRTEAPALWGGGPWMRFCRFSRSGFAPSRSPLWSRWCGQSFRLGGRIQKGAAKIRCLSYQPFPLFRVLSWPRRK
jgi:hypothetical protein